MTDLPVLRSRQAPIPNGATVLPAQAAPAMNLSEVERVCNMIASGGDMVPPAYRGKPGAVLLVKMWADKHLGGDLLTAIQNVYPIQGKPYVAAEMRVELASLKGYDIEVVESTARRCELEVTTPKGRLHRVVAAMPDQPEETGCIFVQPAPEDLSKATWKTRTSDMLYALACRVADRRLVRSGAALIDTAQDYADEPDTLAVLAPQPVEVWGPVDGRAPAVADEPTPATAAALDDRVTEADLLSAATTAGVARPRSALLKHAQTNLGWSGGTIEDLVADQSVAHLLLQAIGRGEL